MREVNLSDLPDLTELVKGVKILMGFSTESLYVPIHSLPVVDINGNDVGEFRWNDEKEDVVFVPAKS